jgi:hypothetical protein
MPEGSPNVESNVPEILLIAAEPVELEPEAPEPVEPEAPGAAGVEPEPEAAGAAVDVEPDMFEMKSAAEEYQQQCHKVQDGVQFLLLPVYLYWPEHIVSCLLDTHMVQVV